jgi:hypothetical protein
MAVGARIETLDGMSFLLGAFVIVSVWMTIDYAEGE